MSRVLLSESTHAESFQGKTAAAFLSLKVERWVPTILFPLAIWFAPLGLEPRARHVVAITAFMIIGWITELVDHAIVGLVGCYLYWVTGSTTFGVAFSGFANDGVWFLFAALLFGVMATKSGVPRRLAYKLMSYAGDDYSRILLGLVILDFLLTFLVPSGTSRVVILASIGVGLMEAFNIPKGSNLGRGLFLMLTYTATLFDKMIIAGTSSITARNLIETFGHIPVLYSRWFIAYLPCDILTILAAWKLTLWLYPPEWHELPKGSEFFKGQLQRMGRWSVVEKKAIALMLVALSFWMTDAWHHLSPSMVGLGVGLLALMPVLGVLDSNDLKSMDYLPMFFVATAVSMGQALDSTKTLDTLTRTMFTWMAPFLHGTYSATIVTYWVAFLYHLVLASDVSMLGTSIPPLMQLAGSLHLNPLGLGIIWTFAAGGKIFMYQSAVLILGYSYGYFRPKDLFVFGLCLTIVESLILLVIVPFYWPLIGIH